MKASAITLVDFYKTNHHRMYPKNTIKIYSNGTARKSRMPGVNKIVVFGIQAAIRKMRELFRDQFFNRPLEEVIAEYSRHIPGDTKHIEELHKLGYLPLRIKALPEGSLCPIKVPFLTITNTKKKFYWLTNYLETLISTLTWQAITSATIAHEYRKLLEKYARETGGDPTFIDWQAHDFSMRGMGGLDADIASGMGHLISFTGTDNIPAIYGAEEYYDAKGFIGGSVPATEHSVMCMYGKTDEIECFKELLSRFPTGLLSVVSDTWDLWKVVTEYLPLLKDLILSREGKLVIRPDSGDPVDIICGKPGFYVKDSKVYQSYFKDYNGGGAWREQQVDHVSIPEAKGLIELLWDTFGGTINAKGYKELDPHIGAIYGDSITLDRAKAICERLKAKGFATTNIVFGIGSFTYQYNTRDTFGMAIKATYGEVEHLVGDPTKGDAHGYWVIEPREIWKDPATDDGTKRSAKGLLAVFDTTEMTDEGAYMTFTLFDQATKEMEEKGALRLIFEDGELFNQVTFEEVKQTLRNYSTPVKERVVV